MKRSRGVRVLVGTVAGLCLLLILYAIGRINPDDLLRTSTVVWTGTDWVDGTGYWLTNDRFRAITYSADNHVIMVELQHATSDKATRVTHALPISAPMIPGINMTYPNGVTVQEAFFDCDWSPLGYLLCTDYRGRAMVVDPEGDKVIPVSGLTPGTPWLGQKWLPDGKWIVALSVDVPSRLWIVDPFHPNHDRRLTVDTGIIALPTGFDRQGRLAMRGVGTSGMMDTLTFLPLGDASGQSVSSSLQVNIPWGYQVANVTLSRSGDTLLWTLWRDGSIPRTWTEKLLAHVIHPHKYLEVSIWTSRLQQTGIKRIGAIKLEPNAPEAALVPYKDVLQATWLPDGKRFSFVFRHKLYVHPIGG